MRITRPDRRRAVLIAAAATMLVGLVAGPAAAASTTPSYPVGDAGTADTAWLTAPGSDPAGVNVWTCRPSAAHPEPVVLVPGTTSTVAASWAAVGPILANAGYCVYGLNYGATGLTALTGGSIGAVGDIPTSAGQLSAFVDRVLASTGAAKVDVVGWSQGGMMPRYYLKYLGGAAKVDQLIGLAPSNHGTSFLGLLTLITKASTATRVPWLSLGGCPACSQQYSGSALITALNAGSETVPGVRYTVIETADDEIVTPYTSAFLTGANVTNILLQKACPLDATEHMGIDYDANAVQYVLNALGANLAGFRPTCYAAVPFLGTPTIASLHLGS